jgi:lysophospholipase L1-like esterase
MFKAKSRVIYYPILFLVFLAIYLYSANAFIYYRISRGYFTLPNRENSHLMISDQTKEIKTYAAIGDSLTSGVGAEKYEETYPYILASKLSLNGENINLKNFSTPGFKSEDVYGIFIGPAVRSNPQIITLMIGVNDIHNHVGKDVFENNYRLILERLIKETKAKIYLINIPFIGSNTAIIPPLDYYFDRETDEYNKIIKKLAEEYKLFYIDLNSPMKELFKKDGKHYASDSFHPSAYGYKLWADLIYDSINK